MPLLREPNARAFARRLGAILLPVVVLNCGDDPAGATTGDACVWNADGTAEQVRVHVFNSTNTAQMRVTVTVGTTSCVIEDEDGNLYLPTNDDATFGPLGQALVTAAVGTNITITIASAGLQGFTTCVVSADAFENLPPDAHAGQAFANAFAGSPPRIDCAEGLGGTP